MRNWNSGDLGGFWKSFWGHGLQEAYELTTLPSSGRLIRRRTAAAVWTHIAHHLGACHPPRQMRHRALDEASLRINYAISQLYFRPAFQSTR